MAFYTVMTPPPGSGGARGEIEQARLLPESFSKSAFLLTILWLLGKRLWLASLVFVLAGAGLIYLSNRFGLHPAALTFSYWAAALFLGIEGNNLVMRKLARLGWRLADVVEGRDLAEAERRYFERALAGDRPMPRAAVATSSQPMPPSGSLPIIGLFPEAKGR